MLSEYGTVEPPAVDFVHPAVGAPPTHGHGRVGHERCVSVRLKESFDMRVRLERVDLTSQEYGEVESRATRQQSSYAFQGRLDMPKVHVMTRASVKEVDIIEGPKAFPRLLVGNPRTLLVNVNEECRVSRLQPLDQSD